MTDLLDHIGSTTSVDVDAPAETTWALLTDIHAEQTALPHIRFDVPDPDAPFAVGFRWSETPIGGDDTTFRRVAAHDPQAMTFTIVNAGPVRGPRRATRVEVTATSDTTSRLSMAHGTVGGTAPMRWLRRLEGRLTGRRAAQDFHDDLRLLADAAERRARQRPGMPPRSA